MKVLVFGPTGDQGAAQLERLRAGGHRPVAATRRPDQSLSEAVFADFDQPASLSAALVGMDAVFLNFPSTSFQVAAPLIDAARIIAEAAAQEKNVKMLVFNSSLPMVPQKLGFAAQDARFDMREVILASGVPVVTVAPVVFLDNLLTQWVLPGILRDQLIRYPHPETLDVSWICHDDLASLMIAALSRPDLAGRTIAVGGPDTVRGPVLAQRLSRAWQRPLRFKSQSLDDFTAGITKALRERASLETDRMIDELRRIYTWYLTDPSHPFKVDMTPVLKELPVRLSSIEDWAARRPLPLSKDQ